MLYSHNNSSLNLKWHPCHSLICFKLRVCRGSLLYILYRSSPSDTLYLYDNFFLFICQVIFLMFYKHLLTFTLYISVLFLKTLELFLIFLILFIQKGRVYNLGFGHNPVILINTVFALSKVLNFISFLRKLRFYLFFVLIF